MVECLEATYFYSLTSVSSYLSSPLFVFFGVGIIREREKKKRKRGGGARARGGVLFITWSSLVLYTALAYVFCISALAMTNNCYT